MKWLALGKMVVAVNGFLFYWIGGWTLFDLAIDASPQRDLSYIFVGLVSLVASSTLYFNAGIQVDDGPAGPAATPDEDPEESGEIPFWRRLCTNTLLLLKLLLSMSGSMLCWLGMYSFVDYTVPPLSEPDGDTPQACEKYTVSIIVGFLLLLVTQTLLDISGVQDDNPVDGIYQDSNGLNKTLLSRALLDEHPSSPKAQGGIVSSFSELVLFHTLLGLRACLSVLGQTLLAYGAYNVCVEVPFTFLEGASEVERSAGFAAVGLTLVLCCDSLVHPTPAELREMVALRHTTSSQQLTPQQIRGHMAMLYARSLGVLTGSLMISTGMWILADKLMGFPAGVGRRKHLAAIRSQELEIRVVRLLLPRTSRYRSVRGQLSSAIAAKKLLLHLRSKSPRVAA